MGINKEKKEKKSCVPKVLAVDLLPRPINYLCSYTPKSNDLITY